MPDGPSPESFRGLTLYPFQREAIGAIFAGESVVVAAPTGAGKTLVADFAIEQALSQDRRVVYTSPIKALSNQKFRDFRASYGDERVGLMTGDVTISPEAALLIMTTEIFRNTLFEAPERLAGFDFVIFDEVHYLDDRERGTVWEEAIIYAPPHMRIVALSATVPNVAQFASWIESVREQPVRVIVEEERPVPLVHKVWIPGMGPRGLDEVRGYYASIGRLGRARDRGPRRGRHRRGRRLGRRERARILEDAGQDLVDFMERRKLLPAIYFCFSRRDCEQLARSHAGRDLLTTNERRRMLETFDDLAQRYEVVDAVSTRELRGLASHGVLFHHAGMLPIDKEVVERLFNTGLVKLLFATETFALGVNMPARSVCFHTLLKYDGVSFGPLLARQYWQMAGRAGRQGMDKRGTVFALLDETEVEYPTLERLQSGRTEIVQSRFNLNYAAILNLYARLGEGVVEAWEKSFARFQMERPKHKGRKPRNRKRVSRPPAHEGRGGRRIRARLQVLRGAHYLDDEGLTRKGQLCAKINGYEIASTEAYEGGWLFRCDPVQAVMLYASIIYEARPADAAARPTRSLKGIAVPFQGRMAEFAALEAQAGIRAPTRGPDFGMAGAVQRWADGMDFDDVLDHTSLAGGDLVRLLRMTIQLLRQTAHALPPGDPCIEVLHAARHAIDRDVVDARRQLELG